MRFLRRFRLHLGGKLFASYLVIVLVGGLTVFVAAELVAPAIFARHLALMSAWLGEAAALGDDLLASFRHAMVESLSRALIVGVGLALLLSWWMTRTLTAPIGRMMAVARRIAAGHYGERVAVSASHNPDELGQLAIHFNQMAGALDQAETRRGELIADVAHELRTPLSAIQGYLEGLTDGVLPADAATFDRLSREAARLQRLVADLQELSRVEARTAPLKLTDVSMRDLVSGTIERLRPQFADKGVAIQSDLRPGLPSVRGDEDRLYQVLLNLVGNALQYTPTGGQVTVGGRVVDEWLLIEVRDTGIGILPEDLPRLFDRFYRVDRSRSRANGGSGIGLTIARHLAEAHGGAIAAQSAGPGTGSTFTLRLPLG